VTRRRRQLCNTRTPYCRRSACTFPACFEGVPRGGLTGGEVVSHGGTVSGAVGSGEAKPPNAARGSRTAPSGARSGAGARNFAAGAAACGARATAAVPNSCGAAWGAAKRGAAAVASAGARVGNLSIAPCMRQRLALLLRLLARHEQLLLLRYGHAGRAAQAVLGGERVELPAVQGVQGRDRRESRCRQRLLRLRASLRLRLRRSCSHRPARATVYVPCVCLRRGGVSWGGLDSLTARLLERPVEAPAIWCAAPAPPLLPALRTPLELR